VNSAVQLTGGPVNLGFAKRLIGVRDHHKYMAGISTECTVQKSAITRQ
jgi:hypothetical protein